MKTLVQAIQTALRSGIDYIRDADIVIVPHINFLPNEVRLPAIGIKDGPVRRTELAGGMMRYAMQVKIAAWVQLMKEEAAIIGDIAGEGRKGVLDTATDIHAILDENLLSISGMTKAVSAANEPESEMILDAGKPVMQRKVLIYDYEKEEARP